MKTSSPESPKPRDPLILLLIGPPGGGKTTLAMGFSKVEFKDCDQNLSGPESYLRTKRKDLVYLYDPMSLDEQDQPIEMDLRYDRLDRSFGPSKTSDSQTVVVDSLTTVNEFIIRKILGMQGRGDIAPRDWIKIKSHYLHILIAKFRGLNKNTIATVHESIDWESDSKNIFAKNVGGYSPTLTGSIGDEVGGFFTDVWRCWSGPGIGDKVEWYIQTRVTKQSRYLKCSFPNMPEKITVKQGEVAYDKIAPFMKL